MKLTREKVEKYFKSRSNEELRHCPECIALACNDMVKEYANNDFAKAAEAMDYLRLLFFNDPIKGMFTHSYGFHTATGRNIIEKLKEKYYEHKSTS